jgi:sec-independent protein translocase protein TatC
VSILRDFITSRTGDAKGEMSFLDHLEALRWHIIRSVIAVLIGAIAVFIKVEWIFDRIILGPAHNDFVSYKWFCALGKFLHYDGFCLGDVNMQFQNTAVAGQFMMSLSVSLMLGFILAVPFILWELWRFIKPALKPKEVKMATGIVFWCSLLFFVGVLFAYYVIAPYTINFFGNYQLSPLFHNIITIENYYDTMSNMILAMGLVFELPMLVLFLTRIGVLTPTFLKSKRRYAFLIIFVISEIITPPDLFSCLIVFVPLYALYEATVSISARAEKSRKKRELKELMKNEQ